MSKPRLVPGIEKTWHKLWSVRLALGWGLLSGVYSAWGAMQGIVPAPLFVAVSALMCAAIAGARVTKQPGVSGE